MMILPIFFLNMMMCVGLSTIKAPFDLAMTVLCAVGDGLLIRSMIHSRRKLPLIFRTVGLILIVIGLVGWMVDIKSFDSFCVGLGFMTGGFWNIFFTREKNPAPKRVKEPRTVPTPVLSREVHKNPKRETEALIQEVSSLNSVRGNSKFRETLDHTGGLYRDLKDKGVHVNEVLTDQTDKLLETYLDLDDDPVQTQKTKEMKGQIENSFSTIDQALENLHDRHTESRQMDLETDIQVMEMKLRMEGLLDSDFSEKDGKD